MSGPSLRRLTAALLLAVGCDGGPEITPFDPPAIAGCESIPRDACDPRVRACVEAIQSLVVCLRGGEAPPLPELDFITQDELAARFEDGVDTSTPEDDAFVFFLGQVGLLTSADLDPEARARSSSDFVGGYYDASEDALVVVMGAGPLRGDEVAAVLAHELVHHLQDVEFDLSTYGRELAGFEGHQRRSAMVEGEAVLYDSMFLAARYGHEPRSVDYVSRFAEQTESLEANIPGAGSPWLRTVRLFPYAHGARHVAAIHAAGGQAAVSLAFTEAPPTTAALMGSGPEVGFSAPTVELEAARLATSFRMGAWTLRVALASLIHERETARRIVAAVEAEQLFLFVGEGQTPSSEGSSAFVWQLRFSTEAEATSAMSDMSRVRKPNLHRVGATLFLTAAETGFPSELRSVFGW